MNMPYNVISHEIFDMLFADGDWRKIKVAGEEIIQRIYFAVRDKEWLNVPYSITGFRKEIKDTKQLYDYQLLFHEHPVHFIATVTVTLDDRTITIEAHGKALASFLKNRIGFCLHLPLRFRNKGYKVIHPDGSSVTSVFPDLVSPHQPLINIASVEWSTADYDVNLSFEGDIFEMEDQRNWTDASYKIYSTPLELPFPVEMNEGDAFYQKIVISGFPQRISEKNVHNSPNTEQPDKTFSWPAIGIACPKDISSVSFLQREGRELPFSFFRIDFRFYQPEWENTACSEIMMAHSLNVKIYAVLYLGNNHVAQADDFIKWVNSLPVQPDFHSISLLSYETFVLTDERLQQISGLLRSRFPRVPVGGGTDANFAQINRSRPDASCLDFVCYSIQPQEHASDPLSIIENIQGQADTVRTAHSFSAGKEVHIASLSFFRRFNANIDFVSPDTILHEYDGIGTHFEAGWFVGALHQLISAGAKLIICITHLDRESPIIDLFRYMSIHHPERFVDYGSLEPENYSVLSWESGNLHYAVFANHTGRELTVLHPFAKIKLSPYELVYI